MFTRVYSEQFPFLPQCFQFYTKPELTINLSWHHPEHINHDSHSLTASIIEQQFLQQLLWSLVCMKLSLSHIQEICSRRLWKHNAQRRNCSLWAISTLAKMFSEQTAAEASESVYMWLTWTELRASSNKVDNATRDNWETKWYHCISISYV